MNPYPFDTDGVQAITVHAEGFSRVSDPEVFTTARAAERWVDGQVAYWLRYTDNIEFAYYGYDPRVLADDDAPTSNVIGTDGYPDYIGRYSTETDHVVWETSG